MNPWSSYSTPSHRVLAIATAGTYVSCVLPGRKVMAPRRRSSSFWAAKKCWMRSAKNVPKPVPSALPKPRRRWKKRKRRPRLKAAKRARNQNRKKRNKRELGKRAFRQNSEHQQTHLIFGRVFFVEGEN